MIKSGSNQRAANRTSSETDGESAGHDPALLKALTEASLWINWQHGPDWTEAKEEGLKIWLADSERHRFAYRHTTHSRNKARAAVRRLAKLDVTVPASSTQQKPQRHRIGVAFAAAATLLLAIIGSLFYFQHSGLATGVGEQRMVLLEDGTQVLLNTATRMVVDFNTQQRHVRLMSGEAFFKVAKRPDWPFVVTAGNHEVTAVGTAFAVRRDEERMAVTLVEGKVAVTAVAQSLNEKTTPATPPMMLSPGERLTYDGSSQSPKLDRPQVDKVTAWRQGVVDIDDMTLAEAVAEMNRYNKVQLAVEGPAADVRVGGVFRSTDAKTLAKAVAVTHGLSVREDNGRIVLSGTPHSATEDEFVDEGPQSKTATP